ncbi:MAG: serine/threonine-protein phosphatase [Ignavibacteriales bacterium]|nr:serine/threonine-protein phosphatase [Ignavibacteriales bacterium]MCF8306608.1 serine/threonine-protein phosphatase [Ignavibacteriales bacterium]MCF8316292.1 serine/threonine-protein phosphatase [Ignavibacteriales bacterium]MCF8437876.1 serine/threonine-protein phosphatase [Ignavibacteriales bacterium]
MEKESRGKKFIHTVKGDLNSNSFRDELDKELFDIKEYYLSEEQKLRYRAFGGFKKAIYLTGWSLEALFYKLSSFRRIILLIGIFLIIISNQKGQTINGQNVIGLIFLLFLLVLEIKDRLLYSDELNIAKKVQSSLLPAQEHRLGNWNIWLYSKAAIEVGGDLIDIQNINENSAHISLGDVSGKGLGAALLMSKLQATIRALLPLYKTPSELVSAVNDIIKRDTSPGNFASLLHFKINYDSGVAEYVNAGHNPPIIIRGEELTEEEKGDLAVGLKTGAEYSLKQIDLSKGGTLVLYSDGVTETCNEDMRLFGLPRFLAILRKYKDLDPKDLCSKIVSGIEIYRGKVNASDDVSIAIIKYSKPKV